MRKKLIYKNLRNNKPTKFNMMSAEKHTRRSKYADNDESFVYDRIKDYTNNDFYLLSINKVREIAKSIGMRNVVNTKKEQLVPALVSHHFQLRSLSFKLQSEEEMKESSSEESLVSDVIKFSEEMKLKFNQKALQIQRTCLFSSK